MNPPFHPRLRRNPQWVLASGMRWGRRRSPEWERARWLPTQWPPGRSLLRSERILSLKFRLLQGRRSGLCSSPCLRSVSCCCHVAYSAPPRLLSPVKWKNIPNSAKLFFPGTQGGHVAICPFRCICLHPLTVDVSVSILFGRYCGGTGTGQCPISSPGAQRQKESIL